MTHSKPSNSSFRYLLARLKPLANVKVWGSLGIMALVAFVFWQYYHHPEWVGGEQVPASSVGGEFEGEVGNSVDIGVTVQDLEQNRLNSQGFPLVPSQLENSSVGQSAKRSQRKRRDNKNNPFLSPSTDGNNLEFNQPSPSIKFEPLMPNVKNLDSLFPSLTPSKNAGKPIKLPDSLQDTGRTPQGNALENALEEVFSQDLPSTNPSNLSPQNNNRPFPNSNRSRQPNYPTPATSGRSNPNSIQTYTQPNNPTQPFNNPHTYTSPQPYSKPYGDGRASAPVPAYPPSPQLPNTYRTTNPNPNYPTPANQTPPTYNYGIQPPQVDEYGGVGNY
ncbi:MAG: hypothetical protein QNJ33_11605 [Crocosphaera sp.]|nr:hypothetical protein [Crocosphaera sp.]